MKHLTTVIVAVTLIVLTCVFIPRLTFAGFPGPNANMKQFAPGDKIEMHFDAQHPDQWWKNDFDANGDMIHMPIKHPILFKRNDHQTNPITNSDNGFEYWRENPVTHAVIWYVFFDDGTFLQFETAPNGFICRPGVWQHRT